MNLCRFPTPTRRKNRIFFFIFLSPYDVFFLPEEYYDSLRIDGGGGDGCKRNAILSKREKFYIALPIYGLARVNNTRIIVRRSVGLGTSETKSTRACTVTTGIKLFY